MNSYNGMRVENIEDLNRIIRSLPKANRTKVLNDAMQAGANMINNSARAKLFASSKKKLNTFSSSIFKSEVLKISLPDVAGIRTGVYDKNRGYILRWLEWGTVQRYTHQRKNAISKTITPQMHRGRIIGSNYFFDSVRGQQDAIFKVISDALINSLENIVKNG